MRAPIEVGAIWRHPVKSLRGEQLEVGAVDDDGLRGDRSWGIRDEETGRILTGRREPRLLEAAAALDGDDRPELTLPDGSVLHGSGPDVDAALTAWLARPVALVPASATPAGRAEAFADPTDDSSPAFEWTMPDGRFVDAAPLLVLTTASLRSGEALQPDGRWDARRFRPNLLLAVDGDGWVEDDWCDRTLHIGDVELAPFQPCSRCTMVTRPQPAPDGALPRDLDIYRTLAHHHGGNLGVWTAVRTPGRVRVGDAVELS